MELSTWALSSRVLMTSSDNCTAQQGAKSRHKPSCVLRQSLPYPRAQAFQTQSRTFFAVSISCDLASLPRAVAAFAALNIFAS